MFDDTEAMPCAPIFSFHPRSMFRVLNVRDIINEYTRKNIWDRFS